MFKNYFTIAFRTLWKNKVFTVINILGLAIGISASLVIYLLVQYDFSFDKFHKDGGRIYRVVSTFTFSGEIFYNSGVTEPLGNVVRKEVTGLDEVVPFSLMGFEPKVSVPVNSSVTPVVFKKQKNVVFVNEHYFNLFHYTWLAGSPKTSLQQPYQVVLSETNAKLYFPKWTAAEVVGKEITFNDTVRTTVTGVVKDFTQNTDFTFKTFISRVTLESTSLKPNYWGEWGSTTSSSQLFVKLSAGTSTAQVQKQLAQLHIKYDKPEPKDRNKVPYSLQPLRDIHFNGHYGAFDSRIADKPTLYGLLAVAAFLLILGCINFINLTTAHASQRAKEIGIRKTMGSSKRQLIIQFLNETFLLTFTATIVSVVLTPLLLKVFADFIPEGLHFNLATQPGIILFLLVLIVVVTLLSGFYPALILSGYKPVLVLKNQAYANTGKTRSAWLRKTLTISQFVIAQVFIMATILVSKQISYSLNRDMGFRKDAILYFDTNFFDTVYSHRFVLLDKLRAIPEIAMVSLANSPPSGNGTWSNTMKYKDDKKEIETDVQVKFGDSSYLKLYQLHLLAGKNIEQTDTVEQFIINETYAHILGFQHPQQAIGKYVEWNNNKRIPIIGVVSNFHQQSLHEPIRPLAIASWTKNDRNINVLLQPQNASGTTWKTAITKIEKAWKEVYPEDDFSYSFFDEDISKYYTAEQNISKLLMWATGLAIFISCLGMLGLVIYTTAQRTKEIGVRKVLGASVSQIVSMISKDFIILVIVAFIIAAPLAWLGMNKWLENFAYRTDISWWIFLLGGCTMILLALLTLGFQTIKAAMANPVKSLRTE